MKRIQKTLAITLILSMFSFIAPTQAFAFEWNIFKKKNSEPPKVQQVDVVEQKDAKPEKKKKEKYDEQKVTAKTDKSQYSVRLIVDDNKDKKEKKAAKKEKKETKVKHKHFSKPNASKAKNAPEENTDEQLLNEQNTKVEQGDAFSSERPDIEGSVSATKIISVDDCVKIALQNNPNILSQLLSKDIYKNQIAQAWSNYFPTLSAGVSYSKNDMLVTNFRFPTQTYNSWNMPTVGVNMLLFDFGKTSTQAGVAKKTYEASRETLQSSINDVVYNVKNFYYNLLYLQQQAEVYEDTVLQYQIHLEQAQAYYNIGSRAKIDVSTAAYNLDNAKLTLIQAKNAVDTGFAQLTNAMGVPEFAKFDIKDRLDKKRYDITFDEALEIAYKQSPTLAAAKKKMEGSKLLVKASKVAFLPDLNGFGSYVNGGKTPSTDYSYQIGAQLSYTNMNLFLLKKQIDEAKLTYKKDQADYEVQRQKVYLDVKQAYIQLKNAQQSIPVSRASMDVAQERYELAAGRYKVGLGDALELKDSQITYMNAKLQYYNTLMQYHISAANLERVMGAPLTASDVTL